MWTIRGDWLLSVSQTGAFISKSSLIIELSFSVVEGAYVSTQSFSKSGPLPQR